MSYRIAAPSDSRKPIGNRSVLLGVILLSGIIVSSMVHAEDSKNIDEKLGKLGYEQGEAVERVDHYRVNGWNYIDDRNIVIYAGPSKRFLITTLNDCSDLSSAENIGFTTTTSSLTKFDKLIVSGAGGIVQSCAITHIKALNKISPH